MRIRGGVSYTVKTPETHKVLKVAQENGSLESEVGMAEFRRLYDVLKILIEAWMKGKEVLVNVLNEGTCAL